MAEGGDDQSQKTQEPTERKLEEARKKGNVAATREMGVTLSTLGMLIILGFMAPGALTELALVLLPLIENPADFSSLITSREFGEVLGKVIMVVGLAVAPIFVVLVLMALLSIRLQGDFVIAVERIQPKLQNISLLKGFTRIYSLSGIIEFLKSVAKVALVTAAAWIVIASEAGRWIEAVYVTPDAILQLTAEGLIRLFLYVLIAMVVITVLDFLWKRFDHRRKLRMSHRELREEVKQTEGDPMIKSKRAEIRRMRARKRMIAAVPTATVVIANPTHFAVALKYERDKDEAPICVAKGLDALALKIRETAEEAGVPVVENAPLARALHAAVELDETIPYEYFQAVAEVISYVYQQQGRLAGAAGR